MLIEIYLRCASCCECFLCFLYCVHVPLFVLFNVFSVDSIPLTRNKSHFELTWSSENDQMTVEREMNIPKRRGFPEVQKQKTAAEFREAHFKLEPVAGQRPIVNFDDKYIVGLKEQLLKENVPAEEICS